MRVGKSCIIKMVVSTPKIGLSTDPRSLRQYQIPNFSPHITLKKAECPDPTECDSFRAEISEYLTDDCGMRRKLEFLCTGINLWHNKRWHADLREEFGFKDVSNAEVVEGDYDLEN